MGFRIAGPVHGEGDRTVSHPEEDEGRPALHWFLSGLPETDPADNPVADREPGTFSVGLDESTGKFRIVVKEPSAGLVAYYTLDRLSDLLDELEEALFASRLNWRIDKWAKSRKNRK